jgi:predicted PhzF superfamily epimerase YddE/YHI9
MEGLRLAAFSAGSHGGNPAGVVLCEEHIHFSEFS